MSRLLLALALGATGCMASAHELRQRPPRSVRVVEGDVDRIAACLVTAGDPQRMDFERGAVHVPGELAELYVRHHGFGVTQLVALWRLERIEPGLVRVEYRPQFNLNERLHGERVKLLESCAGPRHPELE